MNEIANDKENEPPLFVGWESTPESEAANKAYHERIQNGCRLFGLYLTTM